MKKTLPLVVILSVFSNCIFDTVIKKKIIDDYYLHAIDIPETCTVYYNPKEGYSYTITKPTVFATGYNDQYIIAKQHPLIERRHDSIDKSITNYYILPRKEITNWRAYQGLIIGPLTESEFKEKKKELGIPDEVTFSIVIKDLE